MKVIVISDTHLGRRFSQKRFTGLANAFADSDRVVLNGDFWESTEWSFSDFVNSRWSGLFPILKQKSAIYIYGNHDPENACDDRVNLFSIVQADRYELKIGTSRYHFEHGHMLVPLIEDKFPAIFKDNKVALNVGKAFEQVGYMTLRKSYSNLFKSQNNMMKRWGALALPEDTYLVAGHTHLAEVDHKAKYLNSGFNRVRNQYLCIDENGVQMVSMRF